MKAIPTLTESDIKRFWSKVDKRGPDDCWEWTASCVGRTRYGKMKVNGSDFRATRISYFIVNGGLGEFCVCHKCDNPSCINPAHLWLGTCGENSLDMTGKDRQNKGEERPPSKLTESQVREILKFR